MKDLDWQILKVLYEKNSITQASECLFVTQSALTKRLKSIENEWNVEIVKRSNKGIEFTEDGKYLAKKARIMLDFLDEIADHFAEHSEEKEVLRIGVPNSFARFHMPKLMKEYMNTYDQLQFKIISNSSDIIVKQLLDGVIDVGIVCGDYGFWGEKVCLFHEKLHVVMPKSCKLEEVDQLPLIESYLNPLVKSIVDQWWLRQFGSKPNEIHSVPYSEIAIEMVENGLGSCFIFGTDWHYNKEKVDILPIYDVHSREITRNVWMMVNDKCFKSEKIMNFITFVEGYYHVNGHV